MSYSPKVFGSQFIIDQNTPWSNFQINGLSAVGVGTPTPSVELEVVGQGILSDITTSIASDLLGLTVAEEWNPSANASRVIYGIRGLAKVTEDNVRNLTGSTLIGGSFEAFHFGTGAITAIAGLQVLATVNSNTNTATATVLVGVDVEARSDVGATTSQLVGVNVFANDVGFAPATNVSGLVVDFGATGVNVYGYNIKQAAGTYTNMVGGMIADQIGGTNNTNLLLGTSVPVVGNWSLYSASAYESYLGAGLTADGALTLEDAGNAAYIQSGQGTSAATAPLNKGRLRYNATTQKWQLSENTGAYVDIVPVGGSVPTTRMLTAGAGLTGGGDLSADRTFDVIAADGSITVNANSIEVGLVSIAKGGTGQVTALAAFNALSPLTTKGDVLTHDVTNNARLPVGTDGFVLTADSTQSLGIKWAASGGVTSLNGLSAASQTFATGTAGTDFNISSSISTHTFNIPDASGTNRGVVTTGTQTLAGAKTLSSTPTFSTMTVGSVLFAGTGGLLSQDNTNLFWDDTNKRLGIGANPGAFTLDVTGNTRITGKLTVTGSIDPTDVLLSGGNKRFGATDAGTVYLAPFTNSVTGIQIRKADNTTVVFNTDTTNNRIGINNSAPTEALDVTGNVAGSGTLVIAGTGASSVAGNWSVGRRLLAAAHAANQGLMLPTFAGAPVSVTGTTEGDIVWDSTGNALYVYNGATFQSIGGSGITGTGTAGQVTFWTGASAIAGDSAHFWDAGTKFLGLGTSTPGSRLHMETSGGSSTLTVDTYFTSTLGPQISFRKANGTVGVPLAVALGDNLGGIAFFGHNGVSFSVAPVRVDAFATQAHTTGAQGSALKFLTTPNDSTAATSRAERMRIDHNGFVNIGPALSPTTLLTVTANTVSVASAGTEVAQFVQANATTSRVTVNSFAADVNLSMRRANGIAAAPTALLPDDTIGGLTGLGHDGATYTGGQIAIRFTALTGGGTWTAGNRPTMMTFHTTDTGSTTLTERMRINEKGDVRIGTPTNTARLVIEGNGTSTRVLDTVGTTTGADARFRSTVSAITVDTDGITSSKHSWRLSGGLEAEFGAQNDGGGVVYTKWTSLHHTAINSDVQVVNTSDVSIGCTVAEATTVNSIIARLKVRGDDAETVWVGVSANTGVQALINKNTTTNNTIRTTYISQSSGGGQLIYGLYGLAITDHTTASEDADFVWSQRSAGTLFERMRLTDAGDLQIFGNANAVSVGVAPAGTGKVRYSDTSTKFQVSLNGADYVDVLTAAAGASGVTGTGVANQITYWSGTSTVVGNAAWVFNPSTFGVQLTKSQTVPTTMTVSNTNAGASAAAVLTLFGQVATLDILALSTAGGQRVDLVATGNVEFRLDQQSAQPLTLRTNSVERMRIDSAGLVGIGATVPSAQLHVQSPAVSGGRETLLVTPGAHTSIVGETIDTHIFAHTITVTAAYTNQRFNFFEQSTITASSAHTLTNAATVYIQGRPLASGSATISNSYSFWVGADNCRFGGGLYLDEISAPSGAANQGVVYTKDVSGETQLFYKSSSSVETQLTPFTAPIDLTDSDAKLATGVTETIVYEWYADISGAPASISGRLSAIVNVVSNTGTYRLYTGATSPGSLTGATQRASFTSTSTTDEAKTNLGSSFTNPGGQILVQVTAVNDTAAITSNIRGVHVRLG